MAAALGECRSAFWSVALFSGAVNLLMLAGPLYMLQVYDRVLVSGSVPTLVALSVFLVGAYAFQGILDLIRSRIVVRSAALLDRRLDTVVHDAVARLAVRGSRAGEAGQPVRDLDQIRSFLTGSGPIAIVDLPWMPVFLAVCFLIHPVLGFVALAGGIVLFGLTLLTERASRPLAKHVARDGSLRSAMVEATRRNAETIAAMGMAPTLAGRWAAANGRYVATVEKASDVITSHGVLTKIVRLLLQSALLGVGAWLVILGELLPGAMIAASVMMGRALAPLETAIAKRMEAGRQAMLLAISCVPAIVAEIVSCGDKIATGEMSWAAPMSPARRRACRHPRGALPSSISPSRCRARSVRSLPTFISTLRPARRSASSGRAAPARPVSPGLSLASGRRRTAASALMAPRSTSGAATPSAAMSAMSPRRSSCSTARSRKTSQGWNCRPTMRRSSVPRKPLAPTR